MTREELIRIAGEVGAYRYANRYLKYEPTHTFTVEKLEAFAELVAAEYKKDAERYRWLRAEHYEINPVAAVVWKKGFDRSSSDWVNTIDGKWLDADIDRARGDSK